jgi:large subunit ribosomal protein L7/L12
MAVNQEELLETFGNMTVIELSEFVEAFKTRFNVSATAAPVMAMPSAAGAEEAAVEEQAEFDVVLESFGSKKIQVIKVIRQITSLGLKEAKELVDKAPSTVRDAVSKDEAEEIRSSLEAAGASVIVK